jgi:uncharacterized protein (DUF302 family)
MTVIVSRAQDGIVSIRSALSLAMTIKALRVAIERRGMLIHACIDHAAGAAEAGLDLRPTQLFVFGYAEADTPAIARCPLLAIDLPERMLVSEDEDGAVQIAYIDPVWLGRRHGASAELCQLLDAMGTSLAGIASEAGGLSEGIV